MNISLAAVILSALEIAVAIWFVTLALSKK
jgi:hypothetical protein